MSAKVTVAHHLSALIFKRFALFATVPSELQVHERKLQHDRKEPAPPAGVWYKYKSGFRVTEEEWESL